MKILGIDPGVDNLGYAFVEVKNNCLFLKNWDILITTQLSEISEKLAYLFRNLQKLIEMEFPEIIVLEKIIPKRHGLCENGVFHSYGVVLLLAGLFKIPVKTYLPSEIKKALTQKGNVKKIELFNFIKLLFKNRLIIFDNPQLEKEFFKKYSHKLSHKLDALASALTYILDSKLLSCYIL